MQILKIKNNSILLLLGMYVMLSMSACSSLKELAGNNSKKKKRARTEVTHHRTSKSKSTAKTKTSKTKALESSREKLVTYASRFLYKPYRYGGQDPSGFDCSGFTSFVFNNYGYQIPRVSRDQSQIGKRVAVNKVEPGDLMFFGSNNKVTHVAIVYSREGNKLKIIHATSSAGIIITHYTDSDYWTERFLFARDIVSTSKSDFASR